MATGKSLHPIDVIDEYNNLTGRISDPEEVSNLGLWHRGVHVVLISADGQLVIQKRSKSIISNPNKLDISVGGFVDSGESFEQAAVREVKEETGLDINMKGLTHILTTKQNRKWKYSGKQKYSRVIQCSYVFKLDKKACDYQFTPQYDEVSWIGFITLRSAKWLVRKHFIKNLGYISPSYGFYRKLLTTSSKIIDYS